MEQLTLDPIASVSGMVNVPGSKSLSNRALLLAALAKGTTRVTNLLDSDDIRHMLNALSALGVNYTLSENNTVCVVEGLGDVFTTQPTEPLFLGNAGTAMRPLCGVLATSPINTILTGEPRMKERPIGDLVAALADVNADIRYLDEIGYPALDIKGQRLTGGHIEVDGSVSSQFLTAILMAAPLFTSDSEIHIKGELVSIPYIDITLDIMRKFGVSVTHNQYQVFHVKGNQSYKAPETYMVEGDASSASYFLAAGAIKGGAVTVTGVGSASVQGDIRFAEVLEAMGATVSYAPNSITVTGAPLTAVDMDMNHIPDAAMTIATTALFAKGTTAIRNIYNWRVKETDRLFAMATELRKVGATVVEGHDFIEITPPAHLTHAQIDTYDDHRVAMCFSLVALSDTAVTINDPKCTAKTFPDYFVRLKSICH
jgi:3-phosphoshikimate 1-carboxyvinyltransferase